MAESVKLDLVIQARHSGGAMSTVLSPVEQRIVLHNVSWETYERILAENLDNSSPRFTYSHGELEIMSPSSEHEWYNRLLSDLVKLLAREARIDLLDLGSTTFKRQEAEQGFEPDSCFYINNVRQMRGKTRIDLKVDPPPEIIIEIVVTHPSISKFPICAAFGVPEIWTYDGNQLRMYTLAGSKYIENSCSKILPEFEARELEQFMELGKTLDSVTWPDEILNRFRRLKGR